MTRFAQPPADERIGRCNEIGLATRQLQAAESGDYYLIDFNGRMDGKYALTNACGLRAMAAWWKDCLRGSRRVRVRRFRGLVSFHASARRMGGESGTRGIADLRR